MEIEHLRVIELAIEEVRRCKELSYGDEGYMCEDLNRIFDTERRRRYRYSQAILARVDDRIVGWALVQPVWQSPRYSAQFFVDPNFRRQGIGARLLAEANRYGCGKPFVYADDDNEEFFGAYPQLCRTD